VVGVSSTSISWKKPATERVTRFWMCSASMSSTALSRRPNSAQAKLHASRLSGPGRVPVSCSIIATFAARKAHQKRWLATSSAALSKAGVSRTTSWPSSSSRPANASVAWRTSASTGAPFHASVVNAMRSRPGAVPTSAAYEPS
jgi:hypothetical protein